ncbi:MAG: hypothetical protein NVS9B4_28490 [Candidatus Acidiferrum sp.]
MNAPITSVRLTCKESRCGKLFNMELNSLVMKKNRARCPHCETKHSYRTSDYAQGPKISR